MNIDYGDNTFARVTYGMIDDIRNHLQAGNEILIRTHTHITILGKKHVDYIHADSKPDAWGYWLGWPDKKKKYCLNRYMFFIKPGTKTK